MLQISAIWNDNFSNILYKKTPRLLYFTMFHHFVFIRWRLKRYNTISRTRSRRTRTRRHERSGDRGRVTVSTGRKGCTRAISATSCSANSPPSLDTSTNTQVWSLLLFSYFLSFFFLVRGRKDNMCLSLVCPQCQQDWQFICINCLSKNQIAGLSTSGINTSMKLPLCFNIFYKGVESAEKNPFTCFLSMIKSHIHLYQSLVVVVLYVYRHACLSARCPSICLWPVRQVVQAQAPPDGTQAPAQRGEAVPVSQVRQTILALWFVQPAHEPPLQLLLPAQTPHCWPLWRRRHRPRPWCIAWCRRC